MARGIIGTFKGAETGMGAVSRAMPSEAGPAGMVRSPCSCSGSAGAAEALAGIGVNVWGMDAGARPVQDPVVTPWTGDSGSLPRVCDMFMT